MNPFGPILVPIVNYMGTHKRSTIRINSRPDHAYGIKNNGRAMQHNSILALNGCIVTNSKYDTLQGLCFMPRNDVRSDLTSHSMQKNGVGSDPTSLFMPKNDVSSDLASHVMPKQYFATKAYAT